MLCVGYRTESNDALLVLQPSALYMRTAGLAGYAAAERHELQRKRHDLLRW